MSNSSPSPSPAPSRSDTVLSRLARLVDRDALRGAMLDALAVLAPTSCSGCGADDRALCPRCRVALRPHPFVVAIDEGTPLRVHCALHYGGVTRRVLIAVKESGRTDAAGVLAEALRVAVVSALGDASSEGRAIELVTIPSTRAAFRTRGYHPTELILRRAGLRAAHPLRAARQTADQAKLGVQERDANRHGSLVATTSLAFRRFVLVDDIVTTGATLREARRAIESAGGTILAAAALAHTDRLHSAR